MKKPPKPYRWPEPKEPTISEQLSAVMEGLKKIIHPDFYQSMDTLINKRIEEVRQQEKDAKIDPRAQEIARLIEYYAGAIRHYEKDGWISKRLWHLRPAFRKIIELYVDNQKISQP